MERSQIINNDVRVGIYCRLSVDDGYISQDSISIQNQKSFITDYCIKNNYKIIDYYVDDGYSGTNFDRPHFKEMIYDIENNRINTVIVKDLSRFGRDHIKSDYYLETFFPDRNIRFIAISDNYDSYNNDNDFIPFKNIINEMYAKDVSKKIRFTLDNQMKNGKNAGTSLPLYGYMYDEKRNRIIDPETSEVVKLIYKLFLQGNNYSDIARKLKELEIITPIYYNYQKYDYGTSKSFEKGFYDWNPETIKRILTNDEYTGTLRRKKTSTRFKSNKITHVPKEEQYVFESRYEPIIDKNTFETANSQANLVKKKYTYDQVNRYSGLVYCGVCGSKLRHKTDYRVNRRDFVRLTCRLAGCGPNRGTILYEDLDKIITKEVMDLKKVIMNNKEKFIEYAKSKSKSLSFSNDYTILLEEKNRCEDSLSRIENYIKKAHEQHIDGLLPDSTYTSLMNKYNKDIEMIEAELDSVNIKIEAEKEVRPEYVSDTIDFIRVLENINQINCIETVNLNLLISKIIITTDGKKKRREKMNKNITIIYKKINTIIKDFLNEK